MPILYRASDIALWFLTHPERDAVEPLTNLKLQKLLYYAQGWALALFDRPLFPDALEAWAHGPVAADVYVRFSSYAAQPLPAYEAYTGPPLDPLTGASLQYVQKRYGRMTASQLRKATHREPPWEIARQGTPYAARSKTPISIPEMKRYFGSQQRPELDLDATAEARTIPGVSVLPLDDGLRALKEFYTDVSDDAFEKLAHMLRLIVTQVIRLAPIDRLKEVYAVEQLAYGQVDVNHLRLFDLPLSVVYHGTDLEVESLRKEILATVSAPLFLATGIMPVVMVQTTLQDRHAATAVRLFSADERAGIE